MIIKIEIDKCLCSKNNIADYANVLNGIVYECHERLGFSRGNRNTVAVDLAVAAHMLGLDAIKVLDKLIEEEVINPCDDDEDTYRRVETVLDYKDRFNWDYMIDPDYYVGVARAHAEAADMMPVVFL